MDIKNLAIILMIIDHIGAVTDNPYLRIIGRLALPLFLRMLIEGNEKSKDSRRYLGRLALFALISQVPYRLVFKEYLNIFFTLGIALQCLRVKKPHHWIGGAIASEIIKADYGAYGILLTWILSKSKEKEDFKELFWGKILALNLIYATTNDRPLQIFSILGILIKGKEGRNRKMGKWGYYWIYPIHLLIIGIATSSPALGFPLSPPLPPSLPTP